MEGWDAVAEQEYVVRLDNAGGLDYISDCSEKRVVALAEVEFHGLRLRLGSGQQYCCFWTERDIQWELSSLE